MRPHDKNTNTWCWHCRFCKPKIANISASGNPLASKTWETLMSVTAGHIAKILNKPQQFVIQMIMQSLCEILNAWLAHPQSTKSICLSIRDYQYMAHWHRGFTSDKLLHTRDCSAYFHCRSQLRMLACKYSNAERHKLMWLPTKLWNTILEIRHSPVHSLGTLE